MDLNYYMNEKKKSKDKKYSECIEKTVTKEFNNAMRKLKNPEDYDPFYVIDTCNDFCGKIKDKKVVPDLVKKRMGILSDYIKVEYRGPSFPCDY